MIKTFTQNDLIRFLYQETTEEENQEIKNALICDSELKAQLNDLFNLQEELGKVKLEPSGSTIQHILHYSRSYKK